MKPRIKPLPKTGDSTPYLVAFSGHSQRIVVGACECVVKNMSPLQILAQKIELEAARIGPLEVSRLTAPSL